MGNIKKKMDNNLKARQNAMPKEGSTKHKFHMPGSKKKAGK